MNSLASQNELRSRELYVTAKYVEGISSYQVVFEGTIQEIEPLSREILSNATIEN